MKFAFPLFVSFIVAGCAVQPANDDDQSRNGDVQAASTGSMSPLIEEARGSTRMHEQISALEKAGWTVAAWPMPASSR